MQQQPILSHPHIMRLRHEAAGMLNCNSAVNLFKLYACNLALLQTNLLIDLYSLCEV